MNELPWRRPCVTEDAGPFAVTVSYDPRDGKPCEVFLSQRAKAGTELEEHQYQMGVVASKLMQREGL